MSDCKKANPDQLRLPFDLKEKIQLIARKTRRSYIDTLRLLLEAGVDTFEHFGPSAIDHVINNGTNGDKFASGLV